jgi:hypothetical protein
MKLGVSPCSSSSITWNICECKEDFSCAQLRICKYGFHSSGLQYSVRALLNSQFLKVFGHPGLNFGLTYPFFNAPPELLEVRESGREAWLFISSQAIEALCWIKILTIQKDVKEQSLVVPFQLKSWILGQAPSPSQNNHIPNHNASSHVATYHPCAHYVIMFVIFMRNS